MRARWPAIAVITLTTVVLMASSALHFKPLRTSAVHTVTGFTVEGADESYEPSTKPRIEAAFRRESYRSGSVGKLVIFSKRVRRVSVQLFRAGTEDDRISPRDEMHGTPVSALRQLGVVRRKQGVWVPIPDSPSGLYFAKLNGATQRVGYAPFIIRPRRLGEEQVAVVLPTLTWQAYNRRDDDRDGRADTWYADPTVKRVLLNRPFDQRGVPPNYKYYDQPFLRWLVATKRTVDYLAQSDVAEANGRRLAAAYGLLIFPGHHEYVTSREYDAVEGFRNRGGNLMFLSANNFFWKTVIRGNYMSRVAKWRDVGRPEAALIGVQYIGNDDGTHRDAYHVRDTEGVPWLFEGTELTRGSTLGSGFGIEIDKRAPSSPRSVRVLAELPNLLGRGKTAQMTYYEKRGARVFAAGSFGLVGSLRLSSVNLMMENLWAHLAPLAPGAPRRIRHALRSRQPRP
jgi:N,N-dimethylformamidase beta subunit-like, C-terminal